MQWVMLSSQSQLLLAAKEIHVQPDDSSIITNLIIRFYNP